MLPFLPLGCYFIRVPLLLTHTHTLCHAAADHVPVRTCLYAWHGQTCVCLHKSRTCPDAAQYFSGTQTNNKLRDCHTVAFIMCLWELSGTPVVRTDCLFAEQFYKHKLNEFLVCHTFTNTN